MNGEALSSFAHIHHDHGQTRTLFLLHGTGGDEHNLVPLVEPIAETFNIVGLRGNVLESGMPRFFARKAMGVFDMESLATETDKLAGFLAAWYQTHALVAEQAAFVGYSNGANMILASLFRHPDLIHNAALLHAMLPFDPPDLDLAGKRILLTRGLRDPMVPAAESEQVTAALEARGAAVEVFEHAGGHELTAEEREALLHFLRSI
jgi:phospholipase/carboxylesterase